ncbi:MAG: ATP-dependent DNA helicase RecG [Geminicoccaceae bacterium]
MALAQTAAPAKPGEQALAAVLRPLEHLPAVGPSLLRLLRRLLANPAPCIFDLVAHRPSGALDPTPATTLTADMEGRPVSLQCTIGQPRPAGRGRSTLRIPAAAAGQPLDLVFFNVRGNWPLRRFPTGATMLLHGRLARHGGRWQLPHPEPLPAGADGAEPAAIVTYPLTEGLTQPRLRSLIATLLAGLPDLPEWHDPALLKRQAWPGWRPAMTLLHATDALPAAAAAARRRLAYDELLASQLALQLVRLRREAEGGRAVAGLGSLRTRLLAALPYVPTADQAAAIEAILADMAAPRPMLRLLMGDVGSGKTLVALLAMLEAAEAGGQAVLMAPTETLALQHAAGIARLVAPLGLGVEVLVGSATAATRRAAERRVRTGEARLVIGTHALFQGGTTFADLTLAVIDEQHRFGVGQRLELRAKGRAVDMLLLTATPIPRTLLLSGYGDIATSTLRQKPPGRTPIRTTAVPITRIDEVIEGIGRALAAGGRAYWVCPRIGESEEEEAGAAEHRARALELRFGRAVALVHGRMRSSDRQRAMADFAAGRSTLLVATTVIEVGIDVPEASIIVVEGAERFGLAQLHQLRGRVGRGAAASDCVLLYGQPLGAMARSRLQVLRRSDDGFHIAEEDLRLRGPGEVLGLRQSGLPSFRFADLALDRDLLPLAHDDARLALARDPELKGGRGEALRLLLRLFDRDSAATLVTAG